MFTRSSVALLILGLPFVVGWIAFHSFDAFAHNDDFLYARCTEILVEEGRYQHVSQHGLLAASVASHCVWGAVVCWPFGFSYDMLHISVGLAGWIGAVCVFFTAIELGGSNRSALLAALAMVVGPFYYGMSFTFMTDVTASAFACVAVLGYVKGIRRESLPWLLLGAIGASLGVWARQTHLCVIMIPLVGLCGVAWQCGNRSKLLTRLAVAVGIPVLSLIAFELGWLVPSNENRLGIVDVDQHDLNWVRQTILFTYAGGLLLGLVALPLAPMVFSRLRKDCQEQDGIDRNRWAIVPALLVFLIWGGVFAASAGRTHLTQSTGYILYNAHLGPILLGDQNDPGRWSDIGGVRWPAMAWQLLTVGAIAMLMLIAARFGHESRQVWSTVKLRGSLDKVSEENAITNWCTAGLLVCLTSAVAGLLLYVEMVYDRYWLLCYPMLFTWLGSQAELSRPAGEKHARRGIVATMLITAFFFLGSFVFVHDFLAWNHARVTQVNEWLDQGLEPKDFDAGNGINGWYRSQEDVETHARDGDKSHFWRGLATHALAIGPRTGWNVTHTQKWSSWAAWKDCELVVLEKE